MLKHIALPLIAALPVLCLPQTRTHAQTFTNATPLNAPINVQTANVYPSVISVPIGAVPGDTVPRIAVRVNGINHNWCSDMGILLVSPSGQVVPLVLANFGSGDAVNTNATFFAEATTPLSTTVTNFVSGVYLPTTNTNISAPAPAPASPYTGTLASLTGSQAFGNWQLFVFDNFAPSDPLSITGGWSIEFLPNSTPQSNAFTYQGKLENAPSSSTANFRFSVWDHPTSTSAVLRVGNVSTVNAVAVQNGLFTASVDIGRELKSDRAQWLQIEVESPPGSGFVALSPRQPLTPAPQARVATLAATATTATTATTASQLQSGRARIRGDAGASPNSPGIWFSSPIATPIDRAFVGMLDDSNLGLFVNGDWRLRANANGNVAIGDNSVNAPTERLTVTGNVQLNTGTAFVPSKLAFGTVGDEGSSAENTDAVYFSRFNTATDITELRLIIGDNNTGTVGLDSLRICTTSVGGSLFERFRFQSDGQAFKPGGGSWAVLSDPRAKHDVAPLTGTLDKLLSLRGYSFLYNDDRVASGIARPGTQIGLMADEVARVFPDWVSTDSTGTRYVTERATTALMVEALRDLRAEKDAVAAKADAAQREVEALKAEMAQLKSLINQLARERAEPPK